MSPKAQIRGGKAIAVSNIYTAILALATAAVIATAVFVAITSQTQFGSFFKIQ